MVVALILAAQLTAVPAAPAQPSWSDQAGPTAAPLTLAAAVAQARSASPRRRAAALVAEGAREAADNSGRPLNPVVEVQSENWAWSSGLVQRPSLDVFAVVSQPLELGGKRSGRRQLAWCESEVASTAAQALERSLAVETVRAYIRALRARALLETLTANREGLTMLVETVTRQVDEGYSAESDLLKFRTEAARVDGDLVRARLDLERSLTALAIVIGTTTPLHEAQLVEPPPLAPPSADDRNIAASVARHPDVLSASAVAARAHQVTVIERARHVPDPAITLGYKRTAGFDTAVFGVAFAVPIFDRNNAAMARSLGEERGALVDRDALVQGLTMDAVSLIRAAQTISARAAQAREDLLVPAEGVRRAALSAFREGTTDVLKLIDAERVYADVRRAAIDLRLDALLMTIEARFALGEETIP
jgi:cobalt-zinc-cadmium efflux system outer membrane protein